MTLAETVELLTQAASRNAEPEAPVVGLKVNEVAHRLNCSRDTVYQLVHGVQLPAFRVGDGRGTLRVKPSDIEAYEQSRANVANQATRKFRHLD